jgi:hypothetical protein
MSKMSEQKQQSEDLQELNITGPFGGVQSEMSLTAIEPYGFVDTKNIIFRQGVATVRPGYTNLNAITGGGNITEAILGITDFYDSAGVQHQVLMTPTKLYQWIPGPSSWTQFTGVPAFSGTTTQLFSADTLNYKLCFSQGANQILSWDGIAASYALTSANAPAAKYVAEMNLHLMTANTIESGIAFPNRYRWSGIGDQTDWTSVNAGLNDNLNKLGPINGLLYFGQTGYGFHPKGVIQIVPTGIGTAPFFFYPIKRSRGLVYPATLASADLDDFEGAVYATPDNIVIFNGSVNSPIGDAPIDGRRRLGARSRILADLKLVNTTQPFGFTSYSINGTSFRAYWLVIPGISTWVYNFDEGNWSNFIYDKSFQVAGSFTNPQGTRWLDLVGQWLSQNFAWNSLITNPGFDFALGAGDGTFGAVDFTNFSETAWQILSAKHIFGKRRYRHTLKKFRLVVKDLGLVTYTISVSNETGRIQTQVVTLGNGSGDDKSLIVEFSITGLRLQWTVSGPARAAASFVEFGLLYDQSGEQRGGSIDAN